MFVSLTHWQSYLTLKKLRKDLVHPSKQSNKAELQRVFLTIHHSKISFENRLLFLHNTCDFSHPNNTAVRKSTAGSITTRFAPTDDCVLFAPCKISICSIAFLEHLGVHFTFRAVNTIMRKGRGHHFV